MVGAIVLAVSTVGCNDSTTNSADAPSAESHLLAAVVTLGRPTDPVSFRSVARAARNSSGEIVVAPLVGDGELALYDSIGTFQRTIGRAGSGPGEFGFIAGLESGLGDSLVVIESGRVTILAPDAGARIFNTPEGQFGDTYSLDDGSLLTLMCSPGNAAGQRLVRIVDSLGNVIRDIEFERGLGSFPAIGRAGQTTFWMTGGVTNGTYTLELRDLEGALLRNIERFEDWRSADPHDLIPNATIKRSPESCRSACTNGTPVSSGAS